MKKLNITKKQYDESKYFTKKYGKIKFVSESGKHYKTDKGVVLTLEGTEPEADAQDAGGQPTDESLADIGNVIKGKAKEIGGKIKDGAKKAAKATANFFKGNFRKNDTVEISGGEDNDGNPVTLKGIVKDAGKNEVTIGISREAAESSEDDSSEEVTRGELTDILKDVTAPIEKVCNSQDISYEEVVGVENPEDESDDEGDEDEVIATKDEVADALVTMIDNIKEIADKNKIELPEEDEDDDEDGVTINEGCDCGKEDCPECNPDGVKGECGDAACECGEPEKVMESRRSRAKLVREAIARRLRARKIRESIERRRRVRKVLESIRRKKALKKLMESRKQHSIKRLNSSKRVIESRKLRARRAGLVK